METTEYFSIDIFCSHHGVDIAFVRSLGEYGLVEITEISSQYMIPITQLAAAEKMTRLYLDLQVNPEGIDIIFNLMEKIQTMRSEITNLQNRLSLYE